MLSYKNVGGSINSVESFGLLDGPGIRYVIFLNGCSLRCKYCHNPEMFLRKENNTSVDEMVEKIKRFKPYFKNGGGVTFSGGEALLQIEFITELTKALKNENIHVALDTAGVGLGDYEEILSLVDLVILDIKHINEDGYKNITGKSMDKFWMFKKALDKSNVHLWLRQVVVPGETDSDLYMQELSLFIKTFKNVDKVEFLPYEKLGDAKYEALGIFNPYKDKKPMDEAKCQELYNKYIKKVA